MTPSEDHETEKSEIADEHSAIRTIMRWVEADLVRQTNTPEGIRADGPLLGPLESFRDQLLRHFEFEERSGVLPAAILLLTDASLTVDEWKMQHADLLERLSLAIERLEHANKPDGEALPESFVADLQAVFADLRLHDALENKLLGEQRTSEFRSTQRGFGKHV